MRSLRWIYGGLGAGLTVLALLILNSCVQSDDSEPPEVIYAFHVNDSITNAGIDSVVVEWTRDDGTVIVDTTDNGGGIRFQSYQSASNLFSVSHLGYFSKDTIDLVSNSNDSTAKTIVRSMRIKLSPTNTKFNHWLQFTVMDSASLHPISGSTIDIEILNGVGSNTRLSADSLGQARWTGHGDLQIRIIVSAFSYAPQTVLDTLSGLSTSDSKAFLLSAE